MCLYINIEIYTYTKSQQHSRTRQRVITPRLWCRYKRTQRIGYSEFGSKANPWLLMESHCVKTDHINMCTAPPTHCKSYWAAKLAEAGRAQADKTCHRSKVTFRNIAGWYGVEGWWRIEDVTDWQAGHISSFIIQKYEITHVHALHLFILDMTLYTTQHVSHWKDWIKGVLTS